MVPFPAKVVAIEKGAFESTSTMVINLLIFLPKRNLRNVVILLPTKRSPHNFDLGKSRN